MGQILLYPEGRKASQGWVECWHFRCLLLPGCGVPLLRGVDKGHGFWFFWCFWRSPLWGFPMCCSQGRLSSKLWIGESRLLLHPGEMICSLETRNCWVATARRRKLSVAVLQQARLGSGMLSPVIFHFRLWAGLVQGLQRSSVGRAAVILKSVYPKCIGWQDLRFKIYRRGGVVPTHSVLAKLYLAEILSSFLLCRHVCKCVFVFSPFPYTVEAYSTVCIRSHLVYFT